MSSTLTGTAVAVYAAKFPGRMNVQRTNVSTTTSFDPTTGSGTASFRQYREKSCIGAGFDTTGAVLAATGTQSFRVSDSGNRIETILASIKLRSQLLLHSGQLQGDDRQGHFHKTV